MSNINEITNTINRDDLIPKYKVINIEDGNNCEIVHITQSTIGYKEIRLLVETVSGNMALISPTHNSNKFIVLEDTGKKFRSGEPIYKTQGKRVFLLYCVFYGCPSTLGGVFSSEEAAMDFIDSNLEEWEDSCTLEIKILNGIIPQTEKIYDWSITRENGHKKKALERDYGLEALKRDMKNYGESNNV